MIYMLFDWWAGRRFALSRTSWPWGQALVTS